MHEVTISEGFYLGKYAVTQDQGEAVMGARPWQRKSYLSIWSRFLMPKTSARAQQDEGYMKDRDFVCSGGNYPAVYISGDDAQAFIRRLNASSSSGVYD